MYCRLLVVVSLSLALAPAAAFGQLPTDELAELRSRLDRLERENTELKRDVEQRLTPAQPQSPVDLGDDRVRSLVEELLTERGLATSFTSTAVVDAATAPGEGPGVEVGKDLSMAG